MTEAKSRKPPPKDLQTQGKALWRSVLTKYTLNPAETEILHELAWTTDELDKLIAAIADQPPVVEGSHGQPRPNPLLAEIRLHRKLADQLAVALALPLDGAETIGRRRSAQARIAVMQRWHRGA